MCLGIPVKVIKVFYENGYRMAKVDAGGLIMEIDASIIEDLREGDYVIVHAGIAINKLRKDEAEEILELFREMAISSEA